MRDGPKTKLVLMRDHKANLNFICVLARGIQLNNNL